MSGNRDKWVEHGSYLDEVEAWLVPGGGKAGGRKASIWDTLTVGAMHEPSGEAPKAVVVMASETRGSPSFSPVTIDAL